MATTQDAIGFAKTHALPGHPDTSGLAAFSIFVDGTAEHQKACVYQAICGMDPGNAGRTAKQIEKVVLGEDARKRLTDLKEDGALFPHPTERRPNPGTGKLAQVWYRKLDYLKDLANRVKARQLRELEEKRDMQIKIEELAGACKELSKAMNTMFVAASAAAAAQKRVNDATGAFTPKELKTTVDVDAVDMETQVTGVNVDVSAATGTAGGTVVPSLGAGVTEQPAVQPQVQPQAQPAQQMPTMPGAQQVQPQHQMQHQMQMPQMATMPGPQPAQAQAPQQPANGAITIDHVQGEILSVTQRMPAIVAHLQTTLLPKYAPQGNGIQGISPEHYVSFLAELQQLEQALLAQQRTAV